MQRACATSHVSGLGEGLGLPNWQAWDGRVRPRSPTSTSIKVHIQYEKCVSSRVRVVCGVRVKPYERNFNALSKTRCRKRCTVALQGCIVSIGNYTHSPRSVDCSCSLIQTSQTTRRSSGIQYRMFLTCCCHMLCNTVLIRYAKLHYTVKLPL